MNLKVTSNQINEVKQQLIEENQLEKLTLPNFIIKSLKQNKTSLGEHPSFPFGDEKTFEEKILLKRFNEVGRAVAKIQGLEQYDKKYLIDKLTEFITKAITIEKEIRSELEEICYNYVCKQFDLTPGDLNIRCELKDKITPENEPNIEPQLLDETEFEDTDSMDDLGKEIYKRRLIDSMVLGASVRMSEDYEPILNNIYKLNPALPELYYNIIKLNDYLSFIKETAPSSNNLGGFVSVDLSSDEPIIYSEAIIFPVLVFETIKGVMELVSSHGLPENKNDAEYVIGKADFMLAENWDKRFGVGLYDLFIKNIQNKKLQTEIFNEIIDLPPVVFFKKMKEIFAGTIKGRMYINSVERYVTRERGFGDIDAAIGKDSEGFDTFTLGGDAEGASSSGSDFYFEASDFELDEKEDYSLGSDQEGYFSIEELAEDLEKNNRFNQLGDEKYENCLMSDLARMELIEWFFKKYNVDSNYNVEQPSFNKLIDDWDGYDDQVYVQNNLVNNEIVFWEGWANECWKAAYSKPEYKNLKKTDVIDKIINNRFPRVASEFGFAVKSGEYFKCNGKFIMKIIFVKLPVDKFNGADPIEELAEEATALGNIGDFAYDVPAFGDKESLNHKDMIKNGQKEWNIREGVENNIKKELLIVIQKYKDNENKTPQEMNSGDCEDVAYDVIEQIGGETQNTFMIDDGWFWSMDRISNYKTKGGEYWNVNNLKKYGIPPFPSENLNKLDLNGHVWIYSDGKHYDAETINGVANFWDLPIYKRQINKTFSNNTLSESLNQYKELEFLCHNTQFSDSIDRNNQSQFYNALKQLQKESDYDIQPYMQDWSDEKHDQLSLAVIILNKQKEKELEKQIFDLSKHFNIEFDMVNYVDDRKVNSIITGGLEGLINEGIQSVDIETKLKNKLLSLDGTEVKFGLDTDEEQERMFSDGRLYNEPIKILNGHLNQCHRNSADQYNKLSKKGFKIITGYALYNNIWIQHSWGLYKGNLIETTKEKFDKYYGYELTPNESERFCFDNY